MTRSIQELIQEVKKDMVAPRKSLKKASSILNKLNLSSVQRDYFLSSARFNVVPAGRRSGKTAVAKRRFRRKVWSGTYPTGTRFIAAAPTYNQAKRIFWSDFELMFPEDYRRAKINMTELIIPLINGADVQVMGMEVPERAEGTPVAHLLLDEYGNMKEGAWEENLFPALMDTQGTADIIGAPEGRNHYWRMFRDAKARHEHNPEEWATFTWYTSQVLPYYLGVDVAAKEIANAKSHMDKLTFQQEFEASFLNFSGRAYYAYDEDIHTTQPTKCKYSSSRPLIFCFDFNVSPGVAVVCQEGPYKGTDSTIKRSITKVIGEVWIPKGSNTKLVCEKLIEDWGPEGWNHRGEIYVYGDATGGARGTAKIDGSDWDLVFKYLKMAFPNRIRNRVKKSNPREKVRVNSMNTRLMSADGGVGMLINRNKAPNLCNDLDGVIVKEGTAGELDKKDDLTLTHISDALGYYIAAAFPIQGLTKFKHISTKG